MEHLPLTDCLNTVCTYVFKTYRTTDIKFRFWNGFSGLFQKYSRLSNEVDRIFTSDALNKGQVDQHRRNSFSITTHSSYSENKSSVQEPFLTVG